MMSVDVKRAYFYAPARRPVYIEIPIEDYEDGDEMMVGKLNLSLYGTRDAAQNWAKEYTSLLVSNGFKVGTATPCDFHHPGREIYLTAHGDDFTIVGPGDSLEWMRAVFEGRYEITCHTLGPDVGMETEIRILSRVFRWEADGVSYEPDP